jgi:uncharacterized membrane protein
LTTAAKQLTSKSALIAASSAMTAHPRNRTLPAERLIAFSDGVMAVAITLLVLDLKLPENLTGDALRAALINSEHAASCYVLSFVVIGILWMAHHYQFSHIRRVDGVLLWLNLFYLMTIGLIPFLTSVMSGHGSPLATMLYAGVLVATCALSSAMWWHASRHNELMDEDVSPVVRREGTLKPLLVAGVFALSIGIAALFGSAAAQWSWLLAAIAGPVAYRLSRL